MCKHRTIVLSIVGVSLLGRLGWAQQAPISDASPSPATPLASSNADGTPNATELSSAGGDGDASYLRVQFFIGDFDNPDVAYQQAFDVYPGITDDLQDLVTANSGQLSANADGTVSATYPEGTDPAVLYVTVTTLVARSGKAATSGCGPQSDGSFTCSGCSWSMWPVCLFFATARALNPPGGSRLSPFVAPTK